jgi:hypothetical protein
MTADRGLFGGTDGKFMVISPDCFYQAILIWMYK